jgi:hypothetical protein
LLAGFFPRVDVFLTIGYVLLAGIDILLARIILARIKILWTIGSVLLTGVEVPLTIRIVSLIQILAAVIVFRQITFFSIIVVAISQVFLTSLGRLIVCLGRTRPW